MNEYVNREEFDILRDKVLKLEEEMAYSKEMLIQIDKKLDVINERLKNTDTINELKDKNIVSQVDNNTKNIKELKDNQNKFVFLILGEVVGLVFLAIKTIL